MSAVPIICWLFFSFLTPTLCSAEPIDIGSRRQLFLDDFIVERIDGLTRTLHQPEKHGPVLKAERPWEGVHIGMFSPPMWIPDEGMYKQIYECRYDGSGGRTRDQYALAISTDGVHWNKPNLGLVEFDGSKDNNLFPTPDNHRLVHVVFDSDDPDSTRRYKGLLTVPGGRVPVVSPDCLHWQKLDVCLPSNDAGTMTFDRDRRLFMAMLKRPNAKTVGRSYDVSFSDDFVTWSSPRLLFGMDKDRDQKMAIEIIRRRLGNSELAKPLFIDPDPAIGWQQPEGKRHIPTWRAECYNFGVIPYQGIYLGLVTVYYPTGQQLPERSNADGFNLIQLAMSRDLKQWRRLGNRQAFLEPSPLTEGLVGNYDRLQLAAYNGIIERNDQVRFYYGGLKRRVPQHNRWTDGNPRDVSTLTGAERADWLHDTHSAMCLAVLRQDGFVSLKAGDDGGILLTRPFTTTGDQLVLNVDVAEGGQVRVELLDATNHAIPGFSLKDCQPVTADGLHQIVTWNSDTDPVRFTGKPISLRIELNNADLYSFRFR